jgi:hypothetical protein
MPRRIPNTTSPTETRQAFQRLSATEEQQDTRLDTVETDITELQGDVADLDARIDALEAVSAVYDGEAVETIAAGMPIYTLAGTSNVGLARADTQAKVRVRGLAVATTGAGFSVSYLGGGRVSLADWSAVIGLANLTPSSVYFLAPAGGLTTIAPTTGGHAVTEVGQAEDEHVMQLAIKRPILL